MNLKKANLFEKKNNESKIPKMNVLLNENKKIKNKFSPTYLKH